jgi:Holliday junction DNA helicase RuvA
MRIVNELAGKLGNPALAAVAGSPTPRGGIAQDALSALANLGFKPADASAAVAAALDDIARDRDDTYARLAAERRAGGVSTSR